MVDFDGCFFEVVDYMVVGYVVDMGGGVDLYDLQMMELMFVYFVVMVSVLVGFGDCLYCYVEDVVVCFVIIFCLFENFFVLVMCLYIMFNLSYCLDF